MVNLQDYYEKKDKGLTSVVVSDDGTLVVFKKTFDPETGAENTPETFATTTEAELEAEKTRLQGEIALIEKFKTENNL